MKLYLFAITLILGITWKGYPALPEQTQDKIKRLDDPRLPEEIRSKLNKIISVRDLEKFSYENSFSKVQHSDEGLSYTKISELHFTNGRVSGELKTILYRNNIPTSTIVIEVDLCYIYCCVFKSTGKENCTEDYEKFKKWEKDPGCSSSKTTACN